MEELIKRIQQELPPLYSQDGKKVKTSPVTIYHMFSRWRWFLVEGDSDDVAFCYCESGLGEDFDEWGYISLSEVLNIPAIRVLKISRRISQNGALV